MTGVETQDGAGGTDASPAPVTPAAGGPAHGVNRFRANIEAKLKRLRAIQQPTVEEIEMRLFWEAYLASPEPLPRALQTAPSEPVQSR